MLSHPVKVEARPRPIIAQSPERAVIASDRDLPYVIVDLPTVGFVQYAFLTANGISCSLWPDAIRAEPGHVNIVSAFSTDCLKGPGTAVTRSLALRPVAAIPGEPPLR